MNEEVYIRSRTRKIDRLFIEAQNNCARTVEWWDHKDNTSPRACRRWLLSFFQLADGIRQPSRWVEAEDALSKACPGLSGKHIEVKMRKGPWEKVALGYSKDIHWECAILTISRRKWAATKVAAG